MWNICPREIKCELFPLYLAHYSTGPGHYDTLVSQSDTPTTMFTANENEPGSTHGTETTPDKLFRPCRCGVNTKSQRSTRKYSFQCSCIKSSTGSCRSSCKCLGSCGGSKCRDLEVKSEETKAKRKSWKRGIQQLQYNSPKSKFFTSKKELSAQGGMNIAEFYLLHTVIKQVQLIGQLTLNAVFRFYADICKIIEQSSLLFALPIWMWDKCKINKEVRKILKDNENIDSFFGPNTCE